MVLYFIVFLHVIKSGKLGLKIRVEVMEIKSMEINSAVLTVIYALEKNAQHN